MSSGKLAEKGASQESLSGGIGWWDPGVLARQRGKWVKVISRDYSGNKGDAVKPFLDCNIPICSA